MEPLRLVGHISIHALREEGDASNMQQMANQVDFNPRPPRGGRHTTFGSSCQRFLFQSTPSARRATCNKALSIYHLPISIHALREEGDWDAAGR